MNKRIVEIFFIAIILGLILQTTVMASTLNIGIGTDEDCYIVSNQNSLENRNLEIHDEYDILNDGSVNSTIENYEEETEEDDTFYFDDMEEDDEPYEDDDFYEYDDSIDYDELYKLFELTDEEIEELKRLEELDRLDRESMEESYELEEMGELEELEELDDSQDLKYVDQSKLDQTTSGDDHPNTGLATNLSTIIIITLLISFICYKKYRNLSDIK